MPRLPSNDRQQATRSCDLPTINTFLLRGFHNYLPRLLRRNFLTVAMSRASESALQQVPAGPLIVFANHPGWWDPLVAMFLCKHCFPNRRYYAPIDATALKKYRVFGKLGYFGVEADRSRGAADFLVTSRRILAQPDASLWLTPEGRFADPRDRHAELMPGLAHVKTRMPEVTLLPLALEYAFWNERLPLAAVRFGQPLLPDATVTFTKPQWQATLTTALRTTQQALADEVIARDAKAFQPLFSANRSTGIYDLFRRISARLRGERFTSGHGDQFA